MTTADIRLDYTGIGDVLANRQVVVPKYQRSYAWEESHVTAYLEDVEAAMNDSEQEYFLGSIVATGEREGAVEVVDGQQRLATTTILISAVRDWFVDNGDEDSAATIETEFLFKKDRRTKDLLPRLQLNEIDHGFFMERILSRTDSEDRENATAERGSHKRIEKAAQLCRDHVDEFATKTKSAEDRLNDLLDYVQHRTKVIWLSAADDANAFVVFETLNDRGLELAIADLLKNYLFSMAGTRLPEVQQNWIAMTSALEAVADDSLISEFLRHHWSSHHGATRKHVLYSEIKKSTRTQKAAVELAADIARASVLYASIINTDHEIWKKHGASARGHMATINNLGMVQIRPLLLAILDDGLPPKEVRKALPKMVSWGVRFLIVGGLGGGTMERHYADAAKVVRSGKATTAKQLVETLNKVLPGDKEFEQAFASARVSKSNLARYYLQAMEREARGESQSELVPNPNPDDVNLEHILPVNLNASWEKEFPTELHVALRRRLGNLALLKATENSGSGRDPFSKKRVVYEGSTFELTKEIGAETQWTADRIDARQQRLAELAVKTWPL